MSGQCLLLGGTNPARRGEDAPAQKGVMMEEAVVEVLETGTDLTPVLDLLGQIQIQLEEIAQGQMVLCGIVLGVMVIVVLAVMFRV